MNNRRPSPAFLIVLAALAAAVAKLYCAATTVGTNDAVLFMMFASDIGKIGVTGMYRVTPLFNHTPMVGEMLVAALNIARATHTPFFFWLRLPGILADFAGVCALLWIRARTGKPPWWALALFALSPVSFMVSGYHGNVDSILVFFILLAACACVAESPLLCGILLGAACNVKVVPLVLIPIFIFYWGSRGKFWRFALALGGVVLLGWGAGLIFTPVEFTRNVLSYGGYWGEWGITSGLYVTGLSAFQPLGFTSLTPAEKAIMMLLKIVVVGGVTSIAWRRRACEPPGIFSSLALAWILFFVFAPGSAPQYLVWFAPFLVVHSPKAYAAMTAACTVFLAVFYTVISHGLPWNFGRSTLELSPVLRPWAAVPWIAFAVLLALSYREFLAAPRSLETPKGSA